MADLLSMAARLRGAEIVNGGWFQITRTIRLWHPHSRFRSLTDNVVHPPADIDEVWFGTPCPRRAQPSGLASGISKHPPRKSTSNTNDQRDIDLDQRSCRRLELVFDHPAVDGVEATPV